MTPSMQGIVIALLISLLIGVIIGFYLRQSRINTLSEALQQQKKRTEEIEREHERRLQEATLQLQQDYEQQLSEKIELYQTQYDDQVSQLESEYDARLSMMGPAMAGVNPQSLGAAVMGAGASADAVAIEQRIRKQYETRLKEAAQKIQQAYEQHLKLKLNESRDALQQDYEKRLADKIEHYQDQLEAQMAQATVPMPSPMSAVGSYAGATAAITSGPAISTSTSAGSQADSLEAQIRLEYEQKLAAKIEHYQDDMAKRLEELEQEYEARLRMVQPAPVEMPAAEAAAPDEASLSEAQIADLEHQLRLEVEASLKADYDERLAASIERYQDEMVQRTQELEQEYEARLQLMRQQMATTASPEPGTGDGSLLDDTFSQEDSTFAEAATSGEETLGESSVDEETLLESASFAPAPEPLMDLDLDEPTEQPAVDPPLEDSLDLDDLLTQEQGENLVAEQPPIDDSGFDLDNLEDLLKEPDNDDDDTDSLFDNLDDLSNLS